MSNIEYQTKSNIQIECRISNIKLNPTFKSNVEYRISNSISHSNFECRISNIKLNPTFKSNFEYRISNWIQHSNRMSNIEYQTKSNIQILNVEYRISYLIQLLIFLYRTSNISNWIKHLDLKSQKEISRVLIIKLNPTSKFWIDCYIVPFVKHCPSMRQGWWFTLFSLWIIGHTLKARL